MNRLHKLYRRALVIHVGIMLSSATLCSAQTVFTDAGLDSLIANQANWSTGLPTNGVTGTIGINAQFDSDFPLVDYDVVHTNGMISRASGLGNLPVSGGSTWEMNGPNALLTGRGFSVSASTFTMTEGTINVTQDNRDSSVNGGGELIINGGTVAVGRTLQITSQSDLTMNAGSLTLSGFDAGQWRGGGNQWRVHYVFRRIRNFRLQFGWHQSTTDKRWHDRRDPILISNHRNHVRRERRGLGIV